MHLRTLIGPRAGEILDFCPEAAYAMLADGRAEMPSDDIQRPPEAGPAPEPAADRTSALPKVHAATAKPAPKRAAKTKRR